MTDRYAPQAGDKLYAKDIQSVQPIAGVAGYLTGGNNPSALSVFQSLGAGANNGKFKINIDGNIFDNVGVDLSDNIVISQLVQDSDTSHTYYYSEAQSFTTDASGYVSDIKIYMKKVSNSIPVANKVILDIRAVSGDNPTGSNLATSNVLFSDISTSFSWVKFPVNVQLTPNTKYVFVINNDVGVPSYGDPVYTFKMSNSSVYSGGVYSYSSNGSSWTNTSNDLSFKVCNYTLTTLANTLLQTAIRNATGSTETVIYDTNHFKITSGRAGSTSKVLKLMSPSTGTDISGAGATPYLDCATNATEILGIGLNTQTAGKLCGGTGHSALSVFQSLGNGANNGKFNINIDGVNYNDVSFDLKCENNTASNIINQTSYNDQSETYTIDFKQSFTTISGQATISAVSFNINGYAYSSQATSVILELYLGEITDSGSVLATKTIAVTSLVNGVNTITLDTPLNVSPLTKYYFRLYVTGGSSWRWSLRRDTSNPYSGGKSSFSDTTDVYFIITGSTKVVPTSLSSLASGLQSIIRALTGKTETVSYTDRFIIKSSTANTFSQVLKLTSPSTGTDISGAGATPYLDMATNATEVLGGGEDEKLVRLDDLGRLPTSLLSTETLTDVSTGNLTIPIGTREIRIDIVGKTGSTLHYAGEVSLRPGTKDTARVVIDGLDGVAAIAGLYFSISNSTINITYTNVTGRLDKWTIKAYYYSM